MTIVDRSIRLQANQSTALNRATGQAGEIFYDITNKTLRIYDGRTNTGSILATQTWVNENATQLPAQTNNVGKFLSTNGSTLSWQTITIPAQVQPDWNATSGLGQILNKPSIPSLTGYATETYVNTAVSSISIPSLTGYATETYVGTAISNIPAPTGFAALSGAAFTGIVSLGVSTSNWAGSGLTKLLETPLGAVVDMENGAVGYFNNIGNDGSGYVSVSGGSGSVLFQQSGGWDFVVTPSTSQGGSISTFKYAVKIDNNGTLTTQQSSEKINSKSGATGTVTHDFITGSIWYHTGMLANFTANFTNVTTTNDRSIVCTIILAQGATPYIPNAVQIGGVAQTIKWANSSAPTTGNANTIDIVSFVLLRSNSTWTVLGSLSTYG